MHIHNEMGEGRDWDTFYEFAKLFAIFNRNILVEKKVNYSRILLFFSHVCALYTDINRHRFIHMHSIPHFSAFIYYLCWTFCICQKKKKTNRQINK